MGKPVQLTDANFKSEVLESKIPVLVDFSADWCGPCKRLAPVIDQLVDEFAGKLKIGSMDVAAHTETPATYGVMSIPNLIIFKNGQIAWQATGALPKEKLVEAINGAIG